MLIETSNTKLSESEAFNLFFDSWILLFKEIPMFDALCILLAQTALETGHFQFMKNWNFGNIKHTKDHDYCLYECGEFIHGQFQMFYPPNPVCEFNSYPSAKDGIVEYISFLAKRERYASAWRQLLKGDPVQYCKELKENGPYFTAPLGKYTGVVVKLFEQFKLKFKEIFDSKSKEYEDLSLVKEEIENRFVQQLKNISSNIQFDIGYPKYNFEVVWITLSFNNKQIVVEWQKDFGYGIHSDNVGGFPIVERYELPDLLQTFLKKVFEI